MIENIRSMMWRGGLMCLLGTSLTVLPTGCGSATPSGTPALKGAIAGQTAPANQASEPADAAADPADGDTQNGEFEGDHQFGVNDGLADGTADSEGGAEGAELKAAFSSAGFEATLGYSVKSGGSALDVIVAGGEPGAAVDIKVNDVVVLTITLDANGTENAEFSSAPNEPAQLQLPAGFPTLSVGDVVSVGNLRANLANDAGTDIGPDNEAEDGTTDGESDQ